MARRILSAQSALRPSEQHSLEDGGINSLALPSQDWNAALQLRPDQVLFNWDNNNDLMREVAFVNHAREKLDEAAVKIAPAMLRIVLTVKENVADAKSQRAWLAKHVDWDFRRISELCIVAESYGLLDSQRRLAGVAELQLYGWSNALKLAYVRNSEDRQRIWQIACNSAPRASYRRVLKVLQEYRSPQQLETPVSSPPTVNHLHESIAALRASWEALQKLQHIQHPEQARLALQHVKLLEKKLPQLKRTLTQRLHAPTSLAHE